MMQKGELNQLITKTTRLHYKCLQTKLQKIGITPGQPRILDYLSDHDGCIQKDLSQHCDLKPATVTNILVGMEKAGLVFRLNDSSDKRILRVFITEKGVQTQQKIDTVLLDFEKDCFIDFSDQEKNATGIIFENIIFNLTKINEHSADA
jgi:DNA-binding MarR family transcriptional regulator